jgi:hypothetical protein
MYDLGKDPRETNNIVDQYPEVAAPLKEKVLPRVGRWR